MFFFGERYAKGRQAPFSVAAGDDNNKERIRFAVIGVNHSHIHGQIRAVESGGGRLASFYAAEPDLAADFARRYPNITRARSEEEILNDTSIRLVVSASVPSDRAGLGIRVMQHGKDFLADKPGMTTLAQLEAVKAVQLETQRIYSILYSERLESRSTMRASRLVAEGAIGRVVQTIGMGPHRMNTPTRPEWFFDKQYFGGILCDIGSHQFYQFLHFTGSTEARILSSQTANVNHPQYPRFEDFGDATIRGDRGSGYIRVDWFTPDGLNTWGDGRLTILGTDGYIELRKNIDIAGRPGSDHIFIVDRRSARYIDCSNEPLTFGRQLVDDILARTETAMSQRHCFLAMEMALKAQEGRAEK